MCVKSHKCDVFTDNNCRKLYILLLLFWHVPLGVPSTIRSHQPPQRAVRSQIDCFVQCEVVGSQVSLDGVRPLDTGCPGRLF